MPVDWELSQSLTGDGVGIRGAAILTDDEEGYRIVTGNQTGGLAAFSWPSAAMQLIDYQHNHAVTDLIACGNGYATACKDGQIRLFDTDHQLEHTLVGHDKPVTSLAVDGDYLVSGSWDGTAKVWNLTNNALVATLADHENSVAVGILPSEGSLLRIITASAGVAQDSRIVGHAVRLWTVNVHTGETRQCAKVAQDHDGPIRDIGVIDAKTFCTCSNDGTVKVRSIEDAKVQATLMFATEQHPPMLLSVVAVDNSIVAGAEDGTVVVWNLSESSPPQVIPHAECVWQVVALPNGDFGTCSQDGYFRIFTRATDRMAEESERQAFVEAAQAAKAKQSSGPSPEEIAKLPDWSENARIRGTSEGQVHVFRKGTVAIAAQWSAASATWIEVGQVMGSSSNASTIDGVEYDHVFDIQVDTTGGGVADLKLGYNNGENPFVAAQRFIDAHMLPQYHLAQIADYIQQRSGQQAVTLGGPGATSSAATTGVPLASFDFVPAKSFYFFGLPAKNAEVTLQKIKEKILGFEKLSSEQISTLESLLATLAATNRYHAAKVSDEELALLSDMLDFPPEQAFPALDLARMTILLPDAHQLSRTLTWGRMVAKVLTMVMGDNDEGDKCTNFGAKSFEGPAGVALPLLSLRFCANALKTGMDMSSLMRAMVGCAAAYIDSNNKNIRLSVATLLCNVSLSIYKSGEEPTAAGLAVEILPFIEKIITSKSYEGEAVLRALIALGTLVLSGQTAKDAGKALYLAGKVEMAASPHGSDCKAAAKEVYTVLQ